MLIFYLHFICRVTDFFIKMTDSLSSKDNKSREKLLTISELMLTNIFDNLISELGSGTSPKTKKLYDLKQVTMSLSLFIYKIRDFGLNEKIFLLTLISVILLFYSLICSSIINYH